MPACICLHPPAPLGRRRWRLVLVALLAVVLVGGFEGCRAVTILRDLNQGRQLLYSGQDLLETKRLDATPEDLAAAKTKFQAAGAKFASARSSLRNDPVASVFGQLPMVGAQAKTVIDLAEIGEEAAGIGVEGVNAAHQFIEVRAQEGGTLPEKSMTIFERADPRFAAIETRLATLDALRQRIDGRALLPPLAAAVSELDDHRETVGDLVATYNRARAFAPEFLGFSEPKTYLVLAHNNAELLPTGGLISVLGTLRLDEGRVEEMDFQDAVQFGSDWMARTGQYVEPPPALQQYLLKDVSWNLAVSNWSPDFPTAARQAQRFFELGGGFPIDGVIGLNVTTLERLLTVTGPVEVPEFGVTVTSSNAFDVTEEHTRVPFEPQGDRKEFVALLADEVLERVLRPAPGMWSPLIDAIQDLGDEKNLLLYSPDPRQQGLIRKFEWDGGVGYSSGDFLMPVDASVNSTKLNVVLEESVDVEVRLDELGAATTTVTVHYLNNLGLWEQGRDPELVRKLMLGGLYGGYLRLFVPPGTRLIDVRDESGEIGPEEIGQEMGLTVFGRFFALPRDDEKQLVFRYLTPPVAEMDSDIWVYRLRMQKQPGQQTLPVTVRVTPPQGMRRTDVILDGEPGELHSAELQFDLSRDRVIEFRFDGAG